MEKLGTSLRHFSEQNLVRLLAKMPRNNASTFALACASRLTNQTKIYALSSSTHNLLVRANEEAWESLLDGRTFESPVLQNSILEISPSEDEEPSFEASVLEDACAALVYALRSLVGDAPQNAAWAARRAYEATDRFASRSINEPEYSNIAEEMILQQAVVQYELERQERDIETLTLVFDRDRAKAVWAKAKEESVLIAG
jgi:Protein of unknown function (DUF416)